MSRHYIILVYNRMWDCVIDFSQLPVPEDFFITYDHAYLEKADAIVFHMPNMPIDRLIKKRPGQLWVFWSMECEQHYPLLQQPQVLNLFDVFMTYKEDADVQAPYLLYEFKDMLQGTPLPKTNFANAFISSVFHKSGRKEYLEQLLSLMEVHSYGKLFNNKKIPVDNGTQTKREIIATYKFTFAFENAIAKDYVTEKFFDPLIAGSVPVYLGAPNIDEFAPGDRCFINVQDFESPRKLAEYLLMLNENDDLYAMYFTWKRKPLRPSFLGKLEKLRIEPFVRLCMVVRDKLRKPSGTLIS